jgi:hypothetical protein
MITYGGVKVQLRPSSPRKYMEVSGQLHSLAVLLLEFGLYEEKNLALAETRTPPVPFVAIATELSCDGVGIISDLLSINLHNERPFKSA